MIKKIRIKFILLSMLSIFIVLFSTIGAINIYSYAQIENNANNNLTLIIDNGIREEFEPINENNPPNEGIGPKENDPGKDTLVREQYFIVIFNESGEIIQSDFKHTFSVSDEEGKALAVEIFNLNKTSGKKDNLRYKLTKKENTTTFAAIDLKERFDSAKDFLISSFVISSIAYIVLFLIIVLFSKMVFKTSEESYKKQKEFITNASHELKTPLTIISTDIEILEMDNGESEWSQSIKDQVKKLTTMTNQLVTLAKLDENKDNYPFETFSLTNLLNECIETFKPSYISNDLNIESDIKENIEMNGNKYLINELIYILLDNALKYTAKTGKEFVSLKKNKNKIELCFENDIDDNDINTDLLFERFYRSSDNKKEGSGIGLSIAKELVDLHKGKIFAKAENKKIKFFIQF